MMRDPTVRLEPRNALRAERAETSDEQVREWVRGHSMHSPDGECCPDFSCCEPMLRARGEIREKYSVSDAQVRRFLRAGFIARLAMLHLQRDENERKAAPRVVITW